MSDLLERVVDLSAAERKAHIEKLSDEEALALLYDWEFWQRASQRPPPGDWRVWLVLSGRGYGKTRIGAETVRRWVRTNRFVNLVGPTAADVRDVMVEGESGILSVCPRHERPVYHPTTRSLSWPNGAKSLTFSAEDPEQLRGPQHMKIWCLARGTRVRMADGTERAIEEIAVGDRVAGRHGSSRVSATASRMAPLVRLRCSDGRGLVGSAEHPVWAGGEWRALSVLREGQTLCLWDDDGERTRPDTSTATSRGGSSIAIASSGRRLTGRSRRAITSIIETVSRATIALETSRRSLLGSIGEAIPGLSASSSAIAVATLSSGPPHTRSSAAAAARRPQRRCENSFSGTVSTVAEPSRPAADAIAVSGVSTLGLVGRVHNLTVDGGEFYANGILTHNCDEIAAWKSQSRQMTWDLAMFGLRLGDAPQVLATTTPKPVGLLRDLVDPNVTPGVKITKGSTYENRDNLAPAFFDELITKYEGTRLGRQELEAELLLDEGLAYRLTVDHLVQPFDLPDSWARFEAMDYGVNNPTSWGCFATDWDGNILCFGLYYNPGLVSEHATRIHEARSRWWARGEGGKLQKAICYAPADIRTRWGKRDPKGRELSAETEFADHGINFATAQQDRRAGYLRVAEQLKLDAERTFPDWHPRRGEPGAPRLYVFASEEMQPLVQAIRDAPIEAPDSPLSKHPGEAVEEAWESAHGHAHAMLRYGLMSRPHASKAPEPVPDDPRAALLQRVEQRRDTAGTGAGRYIHI